MYPKEIKNIELRKALDSKGWNDVTLWKDYGCFFISCDKNLSESCVYVNSFKHLSIAQWIDEVEYLLTKEL